MGTASVGGSSRPTSRTVRSTKAKSGHRKRTADEDEKEVKKPDVDELRRRRAAYFGRPVAERQKFIRPKPAYESTVTAKVRTATAGSEHRRKKRPSSSSLHRAGSSKPAKSQDDGERRTADYVYGPCPTVQIQDDESAPTRRSVQSDGERLDKADQRRRSRLSSSHRRSLIIVAESEVAPDDSISVVAERRVSGSQSRSRPSLKRSSTTSSKLTSVAEKPEPGPVVASRRSSKRESTLLGALLRRNTTTSSLPTAPRLVECLTCGSDDVPHANSAKLPCGHRMCQDCLKRIFEMSVKDPVHMPPRCCTDEHINLKHVDKLFDLKFKNLWNRKYQEYSTSNRIYCPAPKCGEWIKPSHIHKDSHGRKYAHCPRCKTKVCTLCNNKMHKSSDCPKDPEIAKLVEQAKEKGWQRCFNCSSLVELEAGCNHMTCRCMAEFCMICGAKWKTCECPWFNYTSLPNPDRLNDMRVPEPIRVIYRRMFDAAGAGPAERPAPAPVDQEQEREAARPRERTYQQELDHRRRQERSDAALARRMQLASLIGPGDEPPVRHRVGVDTFGLGNAAGHFLNDDFVQNAADVVMSAFGDANMGRRGERASGRRRRPRPSEQEDRDGGLAPNFLGDASVLGVGPASRIQRAPS
ncbi:hypothetical protein LTR36_007033 [Oleoguttula mirabilis]|uniref:RBR-type E3 ubiquitin transferase n=1 Tax=Oleoguttula mirabilis TaxID=1507867 RepID=A0AAV9JAZ7_9PEZI|nr:hypothetical protein LTR36_007033 [Oleoguttula mirabilis]